MSKDTFDAKTFRAKTFASGTWSGGGADEYGGMLLAAAEVFVAGATAGATFVNPASAEVFLPGAAAGRVLK